MAKLTPLWKKYSKELQGFYRRKEEICCCCTNIATVRHHHVPWSRSIALRGEEKNLVPFCAKHHMAFHSGDFKTKFKYESFMKRKWGGDWEDQLLEIDQNYIKKTPAQTRDYLNKKIKYFKEATL